MSKKVYPSLLLLFWSVISLYFGIGGSLKSENRNQVSQKYNFESTESVISPSSIPYSNMAEMVLDEENHLSAKIFPFLLFLPDFVGLILTSCCFGMLGGVISILRQVALLDKPIQETKYVSIPILSFFIGVIILGLNYIIPTILVSGDTSIRPITLAFLSLFAGIFTSSFFKFLTKISNSKFFNDEK